MDSRCIFARALPQVESRLSSFSDEKPFVVRREERRGKRRCRSEIALSIIRNRNENFKTLHLIEYFCPPPLKRMF